MDEFSDSLRVAGPADVTVDSPLSGESPSSSRQSDRRCVHLAEDSASQSSETHDLLRFRLRVAGLALFIAFTVFLVWHVFHIKRQEGQFPWLFAAHTTVTVLLGVFAISLCRSCPCSLKVLRAKELMVFGIPAAFFLFYQYEYMAWCAETHHILPNIGGMWLMLIFTYALFIPNSWQRAASVIGSFALAPIVLAVIMTTFHQPCCTADNADMAYHSQLVLVMLTSGITSVLGVFTIGKLRREAFEARQLGQYKLGRQLGAGGMGEVYLAEHQMMKRPCAIKVIRPLKAGDPRVLARFEREVRASAKLTHWNNIDIFDYGRADDGTFYYVMEYLPGLNLDKLVRGYGPLPAERVVFLLSQVCDALAEAHHRGLIHRDIKPANIFAAERGGYYDVIKLLDFGLVKPMSDSQSNELTQDGTVTGSPLFVSPEQVTGDHAPDARSDIYSLGAVAYFLLTGRPPFDHPQPLKVLIAHTNEVADSPTSIIPEIPAELEAIVMRCLEKQPEDRFQSVGELRAALDDCHLAEEWDFALAEQWWETHAEPGPACEEARELAATGV